MMEKRGRKFERKEMEGDRNEERTERECSSFHWSTVQMATTATYSI